MLCFWPLLMCCTRLWVLQAPPRHAPNTPYPTALPPHPLQTIVNKGQSLSTHTFGCRLVQRVLEFCSIPELRGRVIAGEGGVIDWIVLALYRGETGVKEECTTAPCLIWRAPQPMSNSAGFQARRGRQSLLPSVWQPTGLRSVPTLPLLHPSWLSISGPPQTCSAAPCS